MPLSKRKRLVARWSFFSLLFFGALGAFFWLAQNVAESTGHDIEGITSVLSREITSDMVSFSFTDARMTAGIDFQHFNSTRRSLLPEDMGSGLAWGDYDNDGDYDLFLVNFRGSIRETGMAQPSLYRNEGDGTFTEVTIAAGLQRATYGMGATWADFDDDDNLDLYLTNYGPNILYRNLGDGSFVDVTENAGIGGDSFSAGSAWGDYDNDGDIDLYVTNYVEFDDSEMTNQQSTRQYGSEMPFTLNPSTYRPATNELYRNNGDGTFADVAPDTPVANRTGRSLGAIWFDFDLDGHLDLYVANDVSDNGVYHNQGDGTFSDIGASSLAADYRGAMGMAVADYGLDGDLDLFVTHWIAQENAFFENMHSENWKDENGNRRLFFMDSAEIIGLGQISLKMVGWSTGFADFDNDGLFDLWVVNGNTLEDSEDNTKLKPQRMQIFRQQSDKGFFEVAQATSSTLKTPVVGRGGAHADYDGDGRMDIAVLVHGGQPLLLHNTTGNHNNWVSLRLRQTGSNTRALGARASVRCGDTVQFAQVGADGSYLSQSQTDLHFGLGSCEEIEASIHWPDGQADHHTLQTNQVHEIVLKTPDYGVTNGSF